MPDGRKFGDINAPIEDTDTPLGIKVLVVALLMSASGMVLAMILAADRIGLLELMIGN